MAGKAMLSFVPCLKTLQSVRPTCFCGFVPGPPPRENLQASKSKCCLTQSGVTLTQVVACVHGCPLPSRLPQLLSGWANQSTSKRPDSVHIVLVPQLMTALWRKKLSKTSDLLFTVPLESKVVRPKENHEPLICSVCLPLSQNSPWRHPGMSRVK